MGKGSGRGESRKNERRCPFQAGCYFGKKLENKQTCSNVEGKGNEVLTREGLSIPWKGMPA